MPGCLGSDLTKLLEVVHRYLVTSQMQHSVLQGTGVAITENESIAINPGRIFARVLHDFTPQQVGHGSASHGGSRVSRVGSLGLIGRDGANGVDAKAFGRITGHDERRFGIWNDSYQRYLVERELQVQV